MNCGFRSELLIAYGIYQSVVLVFDYVFGSSTERGTQSAVSAARSPNLQGLCSGGRGPAVGSSSTKANALLHRPVGQATNPFLRTARLTLGSEEKTPRPLVITSRHNESH